MGEQEALQYNEQTIASLLEPIIVANLLGANIPAVPGTKVYALTVEVGESDSSQYNNTTHLGLFTTREKAEAELVCWIYGRWIDQLRRTPWSGSLDGNPPLSDEEWGLKAKNYMESHTRDEIIDAYFE